MRRKMFSLLLALLLAAALCAPAAASEPKAASHAGEYGINFPFTPSARTSRYTFSIYEGTAAAPDKLLAQRELTITSAQTVFLSIPAPVLLKEPASYTLAVTANPMPGREGLDKAATKTAAFKTDCVCGHPGDPGAFLLGDGSSGNPYRVATPAQLAHLQKHAGSHFKQACDIDMAGINWQCFDFNGTYDGDGYTIKNLNCSSSSTYPGLFANFSGTLMNLEMESANITSSGSYHGGVFVGMAHNATILRCHSLNCSVQTLVYDAGGIIGNDGENVVIEDCYETGGVYSSARNAAGISGDFNGDTPSNTIRRCYSIPAKLSGAENGLIAGHWGTANLQDCYFPNDTACGSTVATGAGNVSGAAGMPLASFTNTANFSGWDIGGNGSAWVMGEAGPELRVFAQRRAGG